MRVRLFKTLKMPLIAVALLPACMVMGLLTGCRDDLYALSSDTGDARPKDSYSVSIALAGMGTSQTRTEGDDIQNEAVIDEEYYIDIDDLYVMTFSIPEGKSELCSDSELLEVLWNGKNQKDKGKKDTRIYYNQSNAYLSTWLDHEITAYNPDDGKDFCIVAIANFNQFNKTDGNAINLTTNMKFSTLQAALKYDFAPNTILSNSGDEEWYWKPYTETDGKRTKNGIPMFGVKRVNLKKYDRNVHNNANPYALISNQSQTLWMLRAFSKIEIELDPELNANGENVSITSASISNDYASEFWVIPELHRMKDYSNNGNKGTGETGDITTVPGTGYRASKSATNKPMRFEVREDKQSAVIYLPEFDLQMANQIPKITLEFNILDNAESRVIDVRQYTVVDNDSQASYWQYLLRNHSYKFRVKLGFQIVSLKPNPWDEVIDNEFNFGNPPDQGDESNNP